MKEFIFIHVGNCPIVYIPKRDFPSDEAFGDFGKKLMELKQAKKDASVGAP